MVILDYKDRRPIYEQVVEKLQELIICGGFEQNTQLPSVRSLATELSINPNTIQRAYAQLEREGYIYSVKGKGSFVAEQSVIRKKKLLEADKKFRTAVLEACIAGMSCGELHSKVDEYYCVGGMKDDRSGKPDQTV